MKTFKQHINKSGLPDKVVDAFEKLADDQRGAPEYAMLQVQKAMGGGVISAAVEHIGDLSQRMSKGVRWGYGGENEVGKKTDTMLRLITRPYGFAREMEENIRSNANYGKQDVEEYRKRIDDALKVYAAEHRKLKVYNRAQFVAREAAVALGEKRYGTVETNLSTLKDMVDSKDWWKHATYYRTDEFGNLLEYDSARSLDMRQKEREVHVKAHERDGYHVDAYTRDSPTE